MINPALKKTAHELCRAPEKIGEFGVELEVEGDYLPLEVTGWTVKNEGSLRGRDGRPPEGEIDYPREYVLTRPSSFESLTKKLLALDAAFKSNDRCKVRLTPRASTHIHLNYGRRTLHELFGFILVFMCVEPVLLRLCGPLRNGNLFCLPTYEAGDWPRVIREIVNNMYAGWPRERKYSSLNIDPISTLGSIEVRCFPNSVDPKEILTWVSWLQNIRDIVSEASDTYENILEHILQEPTRFTRRIFQDDELVRQKCFPSTPADLVQFGVEQAYEVWREMQPLWNYEEKTDTLKAPKAHALRAFTEPFPAPEAPEAPARGRR